MKQAFLNYHPDNMMKRKHRTPEQIKQDRADDRQCAWEERLAEDLPTFLNNTDQRIAEIVEERFDVPVEYTLKAFATDFDNAETTLESIMRAHEQYTKLRKAAFNAT